MKGWLTTRGRMGSPPPIEKKTIRKPTLSVLYILITTNLARPRRISPEVSGFPRGFRVPTYRSSGLPHDSHTTLQSVPYTPQFRPSKKNCLEYVSSSARARLRVGKVESSNPNLKVAHAGAGGRAQGETQHLQPRCRRCRVGLFCPFKFQARFPHSGTL